MSTRSQQLAHERRCTSAQYVVGVLALQGGFSEHITMLQRLGVKTKAVRLPEHLQQVQAMIIPGGESTVMSRLLQSTQLLQPMRLRVQKNMPIWGTCAGAILLSDAVLDFDHETLAVLPIGIQRNAFGRQINSFIANVPMAMLGTQSFPSVFIRAPRITKTAATVRVLAAFDGAGIVAVRKAHILATIFHPELTNDTRFHRYFLEQVCALG